MGLGEDCSSQSTSTVCMSITLSCLAVGWGGPERQGVGRKVGVCVCVLGGGRRGGGGGGGGGGGHTDFSGGT